MNHAFNIDIAKKYDVNQAIMIENLAFWIKKNKANKKNFKEGYYWTYNSKKAFTELFPYWTERQIGTIFEKLIKNKIILSKQFNKDKWDRTNWYTIADKSIRQMYSIDKTKLSNRPDKNDQSSYTDITQIGNLFLNEKVLQAITAINI
jgi:hypothetical protein